MTEPVVDVAILGLRTRFLAGDAALRQAAGAAYDDPLAGDGGRPAITVTLVVDGSLEGLPESAPEVIREGERIWLSAAGLAGEADATRREAACVLSPAAAAALAADPERFATDVLDTLTLFMLTRLDRQPVHGAAVALGDTAAVLAGPSGAGKSVLARAAAAAGLRVLTDDVVYLQLHPHLRLHALRRPIHLLAEDVPDPVAAPLRLRRGRWKHALPLPEDADDLPVERALVCLLQRGSGPAALTPIGVDEAVVALLASLEPGFDRFRDTLTPALEALCAGGAWRLTLSKDPEEGVGLVRGLLERAGAGA